MPAMHRGSGKPRCRASKGVPLAAAPSAQPVRHVARAKGFNAAAWTSAGRQRRHARQGVMASVVRSAVMASASARLEARSACVADAPGACRKVVVRMLGVMPKRETATGVRATRDTTIRTRIQACAASDGPADLLVLVTARDVGIPPPSRQVARRFRYEKFNKFSWRLLASWRLGG